MITTSEMGKMNLIEQLLTQLVKCIYLCVCVLHVCVGELECKNCEITCLTYCFAP